MVSKKRKGLLILICFAAALYIVTSLKQREEARNQSTGEDIICEYPPKNENQNNNSSDEEGEASTKENGSNVIIEEPASSKGTELWSVHTISGCAEDLYITVYSESDNYGNVHDRAYQVSCRINEPHEPVFYLNGKYDKLVIKNLALSDWSKDVEAGYKIDFEADGKNVGINQTFTKGTKPVDEVVIDVSGVDELKMFVSTDSYKTAYLMFDSIDLY